MAGLTNHPAASDFPGHVIESCCYVWVAYNMHPLASSGGLHERNCCFPDAASPN